MGRTGTVLVLVACLCLPTIVVVLMTPTQMVAPAMVPVVNTTEEGFSSYRHYCITGQEVRDRHGNVIAYSGGSQYPQRQR